MQMMKRMLCAALLLCPLAESLAQPAWTLPENNNWKFYQYGGLSFVNGSPVADTSSMRWQYFDGVQNLLTQNAASVSDADGNLRFYTDAYNVWDSTHNLMPGGTGLLGGNAIDGTVILPVISNPNQYYIFYMCGFVEFLSASPNAYELRYSLVDMTLNNGLGDIVPGQKNVLLEDNLSGSLKAIPGTSCNIWLVTHDVYETQFKVFEITNAGISANPVISNIGNGTFGFMDALSFGGNMAVSHDGSKIALAQNGGELVPIVELFDFNTTTAAVTNAAVIDTLGFAFGFSMCFSPDNSKLYLSMLNPGELSPANPFNLHVESSLFQYNLGLSTPGAINNSRILLSDSISSYNNVMRLGPDGKIYLPASYGGDTSTTAGYFYPPNEDPGNYAGPPFQAWLGCIQNPNVAGAGCNLDRHAVALPAYTSGAETLGGVFVKPIQADSTYVRHDTSICNPAGGSVVLQAPAGSFNYYWDDGSTGSSRTISASGTYYVRHGNYCRYRVDTFVAEVLEVNAVIQQNGNTLSTTGVYDTYQWYRNSNEIPGATGSTYTITENGAYQVAVTEGSCQDTSAVFNADPNGIHELTSWAQQIRIYPNPAEKFVYIQSPVQLHVSMVAITGKVVGVWEKAEIIPVDNLAAGVYFLQLCDREGRLLKVEKLVISKE